MNQSIIDSFSIVCCVYSPNLKAAFSFFLESNYVLPRTSQPPRPPTSVAAQHASRLWGPRTPARRGSMQTGGGWFFFPSAWLLCKAHQGSVYKIGIQVLRKKIKRTGLSWTHCTVGNRSCSSCPWNCLGESQRSPGKALDKGRLKGSF